MSEYDRYINLPGFENVNRALTLFNVPVDLYRQGDGSVDAIANPDNLPTRERVERGIESLVGTAAYGLTPLFARLGGQKATQAISEMLMGFGGSQAAEEVVKDVVQDPSRRNFLAGAAATVPVAALAPDVITDVATQVAKKGSRAAINPLDMAMANIRVLRKEIDDQNEILNEMGSIDVDASAGQKVIDAIKTRDDANRSITTARYEMIDEARDAIEEVDPKVFTGASDDAIEEILGIQYEIRLGNEMIIPEHPNYDVLAKEIKRRGMDVAKDRNGISKYPNASVFVEDFYQPIKSQAQKSIEEKISSGLLKPDSSMQMVPKYDFVDNYLKENANKIINEDIENIILDGRIGKKSTEEINKKILEYAETNRIAAPRRAFDNPKVEYVSTKEIADNMAQFNFPRYDVGKFGGDLKSGNINESPQFLEEFEKSGQPTLKEDIFNEGIKEPIEIELALSNGEINIGEGHHRLQAAIELNLPEVPVIVKTIDDPRYPHVMRPGRLDTSGLELDEDYSYSDLNFSDRLIEPRETPEELFRRGGSYFFNPETNEISDRRFPDKYTPMRKGFFRRTDKKAYGGAVESMQPSDLHRQIQQADRLMRADGKTTKEIDIFKQQKRREIFEGPNNNRLIAGVGSLNQTARDMFRGPRGIGAYQQFTNGGGVDLKNFNFPPSAEDRAQADLASSKGNPDKGPVIEGIESLADVEYEVDMQDFLSDNVSRLGFDPDVAFVITPEFRQKNPGLGDHYSPGTDRLGIDINVGGSALEIQAHEYRHRGLEKLLKHFEKYPFLYKEKYGQESFDFLSKMLEQRRIDLIDRIRGKGRSYPYSEFLHENFAEMFEKDFEKITGRYHQAEDGRVLVKGVHYGPGKEFETLDDWKEANPGVDLQLRIIKNKNEDFRETPDVIKFRDYRVQRDRGELKQKVPKFEAVLQIQEAAGDLMKEIKEGKHKELFSN